MPFRPLKSRLAIGIGILALFLGENIAAQPLVIPPPDSEGANWNNNRLANACQPPELPNKSGLTMGFACPRFMLGSIEMQKAAFLDARINNWWIAQGQEPYFSYGVIGRDPGPDIQNGCCTCYQLQFDNPDIRPLIVQWINTGANGCSDLHNGDCDLDLFMGAGGTGNFNACVAGKPNSSTFEQFMYTDYPWEGQPWGGGVSDPSSCLFTGASRYLTRTTAISCRSSIYEGYKGNPEVSWTRVKCPEGLIRVTGCKSSDDADQPSAVTDPSTEDWNRGYVTSMQDCCLPSCGWVNNVPNPSDPWSNVYGCNVQGTPWTIGNPVPPPEPQVHNCCSWDSCQTCGSSEYCNQTEQQCSGDCAGTWCP